MNERNGIREQIENSKLKSGVISPKEAEVIKNLLRNQLCWPIVLQKAQRDTDAPLLK